MASTIANLSRVTVAGKDPGSPVFIDALELDLKADYDAAGLVGFSTMVAAAFGVNKTILGVFAINCKGLVPYYVRATDTVVFQWGNYDAADGPLIAVPTGNMAAYTDLVIGVISQ